jgi:hypothetical protein
MNVLKYFSFTFCLLWTLAIPLSGQLKSEREQSDYLGTVESVRTQTVKYSLEKGRLKAGKTKIFSIERFDKRGNYLQNVEFNHDGIPNWDQKTLYMNGNVIGWQVITRPGDIPDKFIYKYDSAGNVIEQNSYDEPSDRLSYQTKYVYDGRNRRIQMSDTMFLSTGRYGNEKIVTYEYDEKGRIREEKAFENDANGLMSAEINGYHRKLLMYTDGDRWTLSLSFLRNGQLAGTRRLSRDSRGNETEDLEYDATGKLVKAIRYKYRFDKRGNWIVQQTFRWNPDSVKNSFGLDEITYRAIQYF